MKTIQYAHPPHHHNGFVATCRKTPPLAVHSRHVAGWAYWIVFMTSLFMYYPPCFVLVEHSALCVMNQVLFSYCRNQVFVLSKPLSQINRGGVGLKLLFPTYRSKVKSLTGFY